MGRQTDELTLSRLDCCALQCGQALFLVATEASARELEKEEARTLGWWIWRPEHVDTEWDGAVYCPAHAPRYAPGSSTRGPPA